MPMTRRQFLGTAAATGAAALATAPRAAAAGPDFAVQGIDVSRFQLNVDWAAVKASGRAFAFCRAVDGRTGGGPDSQFTANWPAMKAAGLIRGAYVYGNPAVDPTRQADQLIATVQPTSGDLPPVLDIESTGGKSPAAVRAWVVSFISRVKARTGRAPLLYTGFFFWRDQAGNGSALGCPLWLAQYRDVADLIPAAWPTWTFWQYTNTGRCPGVGPDVPGNAGRGVSPDVDLNAFNGTPAQLDALRLA